MIRKLKSGEYRLYSRKKNPSTGKRRNLGTFSSKEKAEGANAPCSTSRGTDRGNQKVCCHKEEVGSEPGKIRVEEALGETRHHRLYPSTQRPLHEERARIARGLA